MASKFYMKNGFDDAGVVTIISSICLFTLSGSGRLIALIFVIISLYIIVIQYRRWNAKDWRGVHFRSMVLYAGFSGAEKAASEREKREFNVLIPCSILYEAIGDTGNKSRAEVFADIVAMNAKKESFVRKIFEPHCKEIFPGMIDGDLETLCSIFANNKFDPRLVVAAVVSKKYGDLEAARYLAAVLKGKAY